MSVEPATVKETSVHDQEHELWRLNLLRSNLLVWKDKPTLGSNLDSNIKRNTGFIKKCRLSLNAESCSNMVKEVGQLKLEKYVSEVVVAISEGILKCKTLPNVVAAVEVISALHQKFPTTFTPQIFDIFRKLLSTPPKQSLSATLSLTDREREEASRIVRQRTILKVVTEVWLVGVFWGIENGVVAKLPNAIEKLNLLLNHVNSNSIVDKDRISDEKISTNNPALKSNRLGLIYHSLKDLLAVDREKFASISLAVTFLKSFGTSILQITPTSSPPVSQGVVGLLTSEHIEAFKDLFLDYAQELSKYLVREHKAVKREERNINERYIARGEINEASKAKFETNFKLCEKHTQSMQIMTTCLNVPMPDLPSQLDDENSGIIVVNDGNNRNGEEDASNLESSPWEDEDARAYYEKLLDLKAVLPTILLGLNSNGTSAANTDAKPDDASKLKSPQLEPVSSPDLAGKDDPELFNVSLEPLEEGEEDGDEEIDLAETEPGLEEGDTVEKLSASAPMTNFLAKLPTIGNRELIDQAAIDFCYLNNKASRNRLIRHLKQVPLSRTDLLSHYSRLIATLNPYFPDILVNVVKELEKEFRSTVRRKTSTMGSILLERRNRNIRYYAELTKFKLIPSQFALFLIKTLLDHFQNPGNVEVLCTYLEVAGRFLYKSPSTAQRTGAMLEIMMRKKVANKLLDERLRTMVDNAFYQCNPPSLTQTLRKVKHRGKVETFLRHILLVSLSDRSLEHTLKILRKLNWYPTRPEFPFTVTNNLSAVLEKVETNNVVKLESEAKENASEIKENGDTEAEAEDRKEEANEKPEDHYYIAFKLFTKIHKHKYNHVEPMANLLAMLAKSHPDFLIDVVDQLMEDIRIGLEENTFQHAQKRLTQVKYLSELLNQKAIEANVIFDTLYTILTLGYSHGRPYLGAVNRLDPSNDFIRIRLCCTILDTCGTTLDKLNFKNKLDDFITFFQTYILTKPNVPMDVQFSISDTLEALRPNLKLLDSYEEANLLVEEMMSKNIAAANTSNGVVEAAPQNEALEEGEDEADLEHSGSSTSDSSDSENEEDEESTSEDSDATSTSSNSEPEQADYTDPAILLEQKQKEADLELARIQQQLEEDEFEREYQLMLTSTTETRKGLERKQGVLDVPIPMKLINEKSQVVEDPNQVQFSLLTKRGNRQQVKSMAVPANSALAISTSNQQRLERVEQQQLKRIVLGYEDQLDKEDEVAFEQQLNVQGVRLLKGRPRPRGRSSIHSGGNYNVASSSRPNRNSDPVLERKPTTLQADSFAAFPQLPIKSAQVGGTINLGAGRPRVECNPNASYTHHPTSNHSEKLRSKPTGSGK